MMKKIVAGLLMILVLVMAISGLTETSPDTPQDPILALYPGLEMGMSPEEIYAKYGEDRFEKFAFDTDTIEYTLDNGQTVTAPVSDLYLQAVHEFRGRRISVVFEINDNKLILFGAMMNDKELMDELLAEMTKVYGEPENPAASSEIPLLDLVNMMTGQITYGWTTDNMRIDFEYTNDGQYIKYSPIQ